MKLGPVTKLDKKKHGNVKKIEDDFMLTNSDVTVVFPIYGLFGAIQKPDFECMIF